MKIRDQRYQLRPDYTKKIIRSKKNISEPKPLRPVRPASGDFDLNSENLYYKNIGKYPLLTKEEQVKLALKIQKGNEKAGRDLILANLRFVVSVAKKYVNRGMSRGDLIGEGNLGLMRTIKKIIEKEYQREKGAVMTYGVQWIRQAITQAITESGRTIRLPRNVQADAHQLFLIKNSLIQKYKSEPTAVEIARRAREIFLKKLEMRPDVPQFKRLSVISADQVREIQMETESTLSLEAPLKSNVKEKNMEEETFTLADRLKDETISPPDADVYRILLRKNLDEAVKGLPDKEKNVTYLYFGLDGIPDRSLEDVGEMVDLTRERVHQIISKVLKKLAHNRKLREYADQIPRPKDKKKGSWEKK
jgi:RNA polymerase primary sigma factor